jgi:two-component sensor histidine kinase
MKVYLSLDQAIPCGLIINELVSNALKYAYPNGQSGAIVLVIKDQDNKVQIRVGDRGIGLPKTLDVENSESLGLQLVYTLIDQLDAEIRVDSKEGTEYLITFDKR